MKRYFSTLSLAVAALCSPVFFPMSATAAEDENLPNAGNNFWVCVFGCPKTAVTTVRISNITSVSKHTYNVGNQTVREVTIDTVGNNSIRIYCLNVNAQQQKYKERLSNTRQLIDSKTGNNSKLPTKAFPEGTYSHNVEYQVESVEILDKIYNSVIKAISSNKGTKLTV